MSSNSLQLLLNIGIFDFLSPCLIGDFISGEINFDNILGGFINEILGIFCSWLTVVSSGSSFFVLLQLVVAGDRSFFFVFIAFDDSTSSSCLLNSFSIRFRSFVRSLVSTRDVNFSREIDSFFVIASLHGSSFVQLLHSSNCSFASLATASFSSEFDVSLSTDFTISFLLMISRYS